MGWISKLSALLRERKLSEDHDEEMRYHLSALAELKARSGVPAEEAHFAAQRHFGNLTSLKEQMRDADLFTSLESLLRDIRFGGRMLFKHPGFMVIAVLALAIGIGVNTAVFTAFKALMLEQLDAKDPGRLVNVYRTPEPNQYEPSFSYPDFELYREQNHVFSGLVATAGDEPVMTSAESLGGTQRAGGNAVAGAFGFYFPSLMHNGAEYVTALCVSENYFDVLGVAALRGRAFRALDTKTLDEQPAVLISENYWQRRFAGNPAILGQSLRLNGASFTIIGVTPHDFLGTNINVPDFWLPLHIRPLLYGGSAKLLGDREDFCCHLYGRLAQGVSLSQAQSEMTLLAQRLRPLHAAGSDATKPLTITLTPGSHVGPGLAGRDRGLLFAIFLIMGAAALVLLISCANVASLQLARSAARQREIGVRLSVGASRGRIIQQLLTESALLGLLAGGTSVLMAWWALHLLMIQIAASLPTEFGIVALHVEPDAYVFFYVFAVSLVAGILFGLTPALESSRPDLSSAMKEAGARFGWRVSNARLRDLLVGTQVTVSLFLLIGAGLLIRGSIRGTTVSPGYETKKTLWLNINFPAGFNFTHSKQLADVRQLRDRIQSLLGVRSVTSGNAPDSGGLRDAAVGLDGAAPPKTGTARTLYYGYVAASYFKALDIPLLRGQAFAEDILNPNPVAILSESAANELWPGQNPLGRTLTLDARREFHSPSELIPTGVPMRVIGIVRDTSGIIPGNADSRKVYLPLPTDRLDDFPLLVRTDVEPKILLPKLSGQVKAVDGRLVVYTATFDALLTSTPNFVISRLAAIFAAIIGLLGLLLACVGIYGAVSYAVVRRTREMGIRMALGAEKADVLRLVLTESSRPVLAGLLIGLVLAAAASRILQALLFGLSTLDSVSFVGISALFLLTALLAAYFPARRATLVDPMVALRCD